MGIWNKEYECMARDDLKALQSKRLTDLVSRLYEKVPTYRRKFDELGLSPTDIRGVEDIARLPFTYKLDLRQSYPYGMFALPLDEVVRIHASSGTTGKQTVVGYSQKDIDLWSEVMARTLTAAGCDRSSVLQVAFGYGLFTGGLGVHYGGELIGASVIPASGGNTKRQLEILEDFNTTMLACTPSYALYLAEAIEAAGILDKMKLKTAVFGAEPWTEEMRTEIERRLKIKAFDIYGLSEIIGPGAAYECEHQCGMHVNEDVFIAEIIDPDTEEVLPYGEIGELVITTLTKEAFPLIRYRTRDISRLIVEPCKCGRTSLRMEKPCGRSDDMLIIRGVNVFPSQIESVLLNFNEVEPHYAIVVDRENNLDTIEVLVELKTEAFSDSVKVLEKIEKRLVKAIREALDVTAKVRLVEPKSIQRFEGKAARIVDKRKK